MRIPPKIKQALKKPLGRVHRSLEEIKQLSHGHKLVAVGDVCVLALLGLGIFPHVAVFDFRYMRRALDLEKRKILMRMYPKPWAFKNPRGTVSNALIKKVPEILKRGGAVKIDGEEDLTALAFMKYAPADTHVIYGQPHEGIVLVRKDKKLDKILRKVFDT